MKNKRIDTVFFDLDGTLVNSLLDIANACNRVLEFNGLKPHAVEAYKHFTGRGVFVLMNKIAPNSPPEVINKLFSDYEPYYKQHCMDETRVYDGVHEMVDALKKRGFKLAVLSNKPDSDAVTIVNRFFGPDTFGFVSGKREGYNTKPDPALALHIMRELGSDPDSCAFVGDTGMDFDTGVNAGFLPVSVGWGFWTRAELVRYGSKLVADSPSELINLLEP